MRRPRWRSAGGALLRVIAVWAVSTVAMLVLAGALPDFRLQSADGDSATQVAVAAALGAGAFGLLGALVWPLLVRTLLLVPALVLGLLVFALNGSLLLVALWLIPDGRGAASPETAVVVAAVMSAVSSATGAALAVGDDDAYRRRLARLALRRRTSVVQDPAGAPPGTVFLQLDGVGHDVLVEALAGPDPLMPTVAGWAGSTHTLTPWRTDWSSQTGASQLGILHGTNHDLPAFRWYEKETGEVIVSNRPTSAAELQRRAMARTGSGGLLSVDGASRGNLFSGGAAQLALVLSVAARRGRHNRSRAGYFAYFSDPANATRTAASFVVEVCREIGQSLRARFREDGPRVKRGGLYPFVRAFATVVERDVVVAAVIGDMLVGRTAIYADLVAYDEVAHHSGPESRDARLVLRRLDRSLALIAKIAPHAPRPYRIVLLSDHGQSPGETFAGRYGLTLEDLVRASCGLPVSRRARRSPTGAEARNTARAALRRPEEEPEETTRRARRAAEPIVLASGNLGLVSLPSIPGRATREQIDRRNPALLSTLAEHPGIGFVLVRSEEHGAVVLGPRGGAHHLDTGRIVGEDPLAPFGPGAADAVRRTDGFPHVADIMINSFCDPETGEVHAFEEQIGSHGGLGGQQSRPFLLWPEELTPPVGEGAELVGAEHVHRVFRRWLGEGGGPAVPVGDEAGPSTDEAPATGEARPSTDEAPATGEIRPGVDEIRPPGAAPEAFSPGDGATQEEQR
ncbi:phage holin family protein [Streptomyces ochraceiscleroticus]|uniref:Phage holin family protein n=1 Tax=Streptomyces ochraceiscleroticus TaxID=47761 RepID=A0ABW1MSR3_9ACTN|nr:phage holin family protein [Streptomyces ochraceiscleroticus]